MNHSRIHGTVYGVAGVARNNVTNASVFERRR